MSFEGSESSSPHREHIKSEFDHGAKLTMHAREQWYKLVLLADIEDFDHLVRLLHYEEWLRQSPLQEITEFIMQLSDATAVTAFDRLVDEFNTDIERIKQTKDVGTLEKFFTRAEELLNQKI